MVVRVNKKTIEDRYLSRTVEYAVIEKHYGDRRARRSGVPYINHIIEGCAALWAMTDIPSEAREMQRAFCLHPFAQDSLKGFADLACKHNLNQRLVIWATDYAAVAGQFLTKHLEECTLYGKMPDLEFSTLRTVNLMLLADKIQNYKDLRHYNCLLPNYDALNRYFEHWISELCDYLDISPEEVQRYERIMLV